MSTVSPSSAPVGVDPNRASIARVYDAALGGKDNYEIDREVLDEVKKVAPEVGDMAWANRQFLIRAVRFMADQSGIDQFIDCGSGLPTAENTHQVVQRINPDARVVYVDNDPVVLAHGRVLLEENENTYLISADIFDPDDVLGDQTLREIIDFTRPVGFLHLSTWHHYLGDDIPELMRSCVDALPSGSFVAIAHFYDPEDARDTPLARQMEQIFLDSPMGSGLFRTRAEIEAMFPGLDLVEPGFSLCDDWWPDGPRIRELNQAQRCVAGAVGRKP